MFIYNPKNKPKYISSCEYNRVLYTPTLFNDFCGKSVWTLQMGEYYH